MPCLLYTSILDGSDWEHNAGPTDYMINAKHCNNLVMKDIICLFYTSEILRVKFWLGLFDNPYRGDEKRAGQIVHSPAHQQLALDAARQSLVLLKNEHQTLPLSKSIRSVAVIGPTADERQQLICRYGPANAHITTIYEGIKKMLPQR